MHTDLLFALMDIMGTLPMLVLPTATMARSGLAAESLLERARGFIAAMATTGLGLMAIAGPMDIVAATATGMVTAMDVAAITDMLDEVATADIMAATLTVEAFMVAATAATGNFAD